jgi:eukaryotic-like serine/threonine-protein kinase
MSLPLGTRIGVYEVVELVGVGGMGEVYRGRDSRLDRAVALKTIPDEFARDPERLARFEREAKTLALLNHPNIASIYGLEPGATPALVMEMVEGETLAHRIATGPLSLDDAIAIARQIADALEHAHDKGIIHRDLKPANVKVGPRDSSPKVKVLDFGLAKAMIPDAASASAASAVSSPTITSPANMTRAGLILGTAAYMAPEQARGKAVDQRADIWAFGCVFYEMLTARRAFDGEGIADVLASVIQSEPDWTALPATTPRALRTLLARCLRKDPAKRLHSIADVRIDLDEIAAGDPDDAGREIAPRARRSWWAPALSGAVLGAAIAGVLMFARTPAPSSPVEPKVLRFAISMPDGWTFYRTPGNGRLSLSLSPGGETLAVVLAGKEGSRRVFVRQLDGAAFRELPGTEGAETVFWAPDGSRLGFSTSTGVRRVDLSSAGSQPMVSLGGVIAATWGRHEVIVAGLGQGRPLFRWLANGGVPEPLSALPSGVNARGQPRWMPDGESLLYLESLGNLAWTVMAQRSQGGPQEVRKFESSGPGSATLEYRDGHLLLSATDPTGHTVLTVQPFDPATLKVTGEPSVLMSDLNPAFSISNQGTLVYGESRFSTERFVWLDSRGASTADVGDALRVINFTLSPDERFLAIQQGPGLVLHDLSRGVTTNLAASATDPVWSPDSHQIAFTISDSGIYVMPSFGGPSRVIYKAEEPTYVEDWSRDGQWLAATTRGRAGLLIPLAAGVQPIRFETKNETAAVDEPQFSPDGRLIAYGLNDSGTGDVFLTGVPPTGERWQVSVAGGVQPRWRSDGRALYFLSLSGKMMAVEIDAKAGMPPRISPPRALFETGIRQVSGTLDQFAVSKDGKRFLVRRPDALQGHSLDELQVIVNWPQLLSSTSQTKPEP